MIFDAFVERDRDDQPPVHALFAHVLDLNVDVTVVLIVFLDLLEVLLQLRFVQASRLVEKRNQRLPLVFICVAQHLVAEMLVAFEFDPRDRPLDSFGQPYKQRAPCPVFRRSAPPDTALRRR